MDKKSYLFNDLKNTVNNYDEKSDTKDTKSELHDDVIIDLTKERISQELSNISADEVKSSFLVGISATLLGILFAFGSFNSLVRADWIYWIPIIPLAVNCFLQLFILFPRDRLRLMSPRDTNDDFGNDELHELKKAIKNRMIKDCEYIVEHRQGDGRIIKIGFILLLVSISIFIWFVTSIIPNV